MCDAGSFRRIGLVVIRIATSETERFPDCAALHPGYAR
jgi:hypothetical protein